jgi:SAM-dependent methyltransferase
MRAAAPAAHPHPNADSSWRTCIVGEALADRATRYILDGSDDDLRRLLDLAELLADPARRALRQVGIQPGWRVLECGCGPLGALAVLADAVGPSGTVVGIDFTPAAVERARGVTQRLGLANVQVVAGDVHDVDVATLGGPFDLAYTRLFLMHQRDPVRTLQRIASLLRPGGWIVAQEAFRDPAPRSNPHVAALDSYWELLHRLIERSGVPARSVDDLPRAARAAGLEVTSAEGFFRVTDAGPGFELHAATLAAAGARAVQSGVATQGEIDELLRVLRRAQRERHEWVSTPFMLDLALRKPSQTKRQAVSANGATPASSRRTHRRGEPR